jgi:transketolase
MPMGMADVATVLFEKHLKFDASAPDWPDRDRFMLSAGHGSMLLYALLHLTGYADMTLDEIRRFRQWGSKTAGHPEYGHAKGIETTTGPLGQGLANAVGFAMAEEALRARFGKKVVDHHTWVIAGDGCLMEGISHEAIGLAGHAEAVEADRALGRQRHLHRRQGRLSDITDQMARFKAAGWKVLLRRPRPRGHRPRADRRGQVRRPAHADRLQDPYRLRRADQAGHGEGPRLAARRGRDRGPRARSTAGRTRPSRSPADIKAAWARSAQRGRAARAGVGGADRRAVPRRKRAEFDRVSWRRAAEEARRHDPRAEEADRQPRPRSRRARPRRWCSRWSTR